MAEIYYLQNIRLKGNEHGQLQVNTIYADLVHEDGSLAIAATLKHILKAIRDWELTVDGIVTSWELRQGTYCSEVHLVKYPIHKK